MAELVKLGVRTILNLEDGWSSTAGLRAKEAAMARAEGIEIVHIPLSPIWPLRRAAVEKAVRVLANADQRPIYVHCLCGRERTNLVLAFHRIRNENWDPRAARREMLAAGFRGYVVPLIHLQSLLWTRAESAHRRSLVAQNA